MNNISFKQYRAIDIFILSVLLIVSEGVATLASSRWFVGVPFALSTTLIFITITMMRWDGFAAVPALVGGVVYAFASGGEPKHYLIYAAGNLFCLFSIILLKKLGKGRVRESVPLLISFASLTYILVAVGRWLVSLIFEPSLTSLLAYIFPDAITLLFTAVLLSLMRKVDGMIEDQRAYLIRISREAEGEGKPDSDDFSAVMDDPDYLDGVFETDYDDEGAPVDKPDYSDD